MLTTLPMEELTGISMICGGNEKFQDVLEQVAARQRASIDVQRRAWKCLSGAPSQLSYESPILPVCVQRASGSRITDVDGNEYIDCHMAYTASILGHSPPAVVSAVQAALDRGVEGGQLFREQVELAELVLSMVPGLERVAFFHTGGEAIHAAVRVARAVRRCLRVAKFEGCYHGSHELGLHNTWMILAGTPPRDPLDQIRPQPATGGVRPGADEELLILPFNSPLALERIERHADELACVVVDPVPSFMSNWLEEARQFIAELCRSCGERGVPVIFDEVVCGFRLARGGAREWSGQAAQMSCYGKITSGLGIPLSILGGEARFLDAARSAGLFRDYMLQKAWLASTLSSSFLPIVASLAQLRYVADHHDEIFARLDRNRERLAARLADFAVRSGIPVQLEGSSRLQMQLSVGKGKPSEKTYRGMMGTASSAQLRTLLALTFYLRLRGVYTKTVPAMNLSAAHTDEDLDRIGAAIEESLQQMERDGVLAV